MKNNPNVSFENSKKTISNARYICITSRKRPLEKGSKLFVLGAGKDQNKTKKLLQTRPELKQKSWLAQLTFLCSPTHLLHGSTADDGGLNALLSLINQENANEDCRYFAQKTVLYNRKRGRCPSE